MSLYDSVRNSPLRNSLLRPASKDHTDSPELLKDRLSNSTEAETITDIPELSHKYMMVLRHHYNYSQQLAISNSITKEEGFTLIQGPPGTGT